MPKRKAPQFVFKEAPADSVVIAIFRQKYLAEHGFPENTPTFANRWVAVTEGEGVYCVFGWRVVIPKAIEITDFYPYSGPKGVLAADAAMKRIKADADKMGIDVVTGVTPGNDRMIAAFEKIFHANGPDVLIYRYHPKVAEVAV